MQHVMVFAPSSTLSIVTERRGAHDDIHLHPGGQGYWISRMLAALDVPVTLCGCFGGEVGSVVRVLIEQRGIQVRAVETDTANAAYVEDRRTESTQVLADMHSPALSRHDVDALYGLALTHGLDAAVCVLGGAPAHVLPAETYQRLTR